VRLNDKFTIIIIGDIILAICAVYAGYGMRFVTDAAEGISHVRLIQLPFFVTGVLFSSFLVELYDGTKVITVWDRIVRINIGLVLSFVLLSALYYLVHAFSIGRGSFFISLGFFGFGQFTWHTLYEMVINSAGLGRKVLVLGTGKLAEQIGGIITATNHNHVLRGYIDCARESVVVPQQSIVGNGNTLFDVIQKEKPQKIVVSLTERRGVLPVRDILACKMSGIEVVDAPSFYEELTGKLLLEDLRPSWLIFNEGFRITPVVRLYKRCFDVGIAMLALFIILPLMPIVALMIKLDSKGPVFFKQERLGEREQPFTLIKFRTMREDAESETGPVWAQKNDLRITRIGRILRKTRLDEFPQLINVLKGDMSFIGPRPERREFIDKLKEVIPFYSERHFIKPGITGWAQIKYPYGASVQDAIEKLKFDLYYIKNLSPLLDLMIVTETIKVVLFGRGGR